MLPRDIEYMSCLATEHFKTLLKVYLPNHEFAELMKGIYGREMMVGHTPTNPLAHNGLTMVTSSCNVDILCHNEPTITTVIQANPGQQDNLWPFILNEIITRRYCDEASSYR